VYEANEFTGGNLKFMKLAKVLPMLAVSAFCLAGCASKVDYAKFHEEATNVKEHSFKKATVKLDGSSNLAGLKIELKGSVKYIYNNGWQISEDDTSEAAVQAASALYIAMNAALVGESENYEYYAGGSFKVVDKENNVTQEFNGFGLLTSYKSDDMKASISYSK